MGMEKSWASLSFLFQLLIFFTLPISPSNGQFTKRESKALFQLQKLLEYPQVLEGWGNWTNFCDLPPNPSLVIVCSGNHITQLAIVGDKAFTSSSQTQNPKSASAGKHATLSGLFSINSLITALTKLSSLRVLSLVSLGIWGPLPAKINRLSSLEVLNFSSNHIYGRIPEAVASFKNLKSLVLADNLFNATVPDLKRLPVLEELDLGGNQLGGKFPILGTNLTTIILRNNALRSDVPQELQKFGSLRRFDISSNNFIGPIPPFLFSLPSMEYLNLSGNELTGALPKSTSCSHGLEVIDISKNLLIGKLPTCIVSKASNRTVSYSWNCLSTGNPKHQNPYAVCDQEALAVKPPNEEKDSRTKLGILLGIIGGCIGAVGVLGLLILVIFRRAKARKAENGKLTRCAAETSSFHSYAKEIFDATHLPRTMRSDAVGLPPYQVFILDEIEDATNNFDPSNLIGEGAQEQLYRGSLRNGAPVLVKCLKLKQIHSSNSLSQYVEVISKLRHQNLISVLGHCTANTVFIVLEDIPSRTLKDHLADRRGREMLKWPQRMAMAMGIARGLHFLHTAIAPGIFGNELKSENILLDENLTPKISNYNIPFPSKVGAESPLSGRGASPTLRSIDNSETSDVFQLGKILTEIITGRLISSDAELQCLMHQLDSGLTEAPPVLRAAADTAIQGTFAYQSLRTTVEIAINCLCEEASRRPSMEDVLWNLQYAFQVQEGWNSSENLATRP